MRSGSETSTGTPAPKAPGIIPHLTCRDAAEAVDFYCKAFGAEAMCVIKMPDGKLMHAALSLNGSMLFLCDECPEHGGLSPQAIGGSPVTLHLQVDDCDAAFGRAVAAGCEVAMPLENMFWGDRYGVLTDPYGHKWSVATKLREVSPEEIQQAIAGFAKQAKSGQEYAGRT